MTVLASYLSGAWVTPDDEGTAVHDAVTGEPVARLSTRGLDVAAALVHARTVGGAALRASTFAQRAAALKALATHLAAHRDELVALSHRTGATAHDASFDVDGGIGALFSYASRGRRELPAGTVVPDGAVEPLGRGGTFAGRHVWTTRPGVAVQVNAFNFPVWGPLEKFAPAFLAGVPSLVKPASPTAYVTHRLVELALDADVLPEGCLALLAGSAGDLLDHLTAQDSVAFTGSAATAARLRTHPALVAAGARFSGEADSLNCSVLGPDAEPGTPEFDLYVAQLVTEMTVKAGQKCTAIRRALVPHGLIEAVASAASERLAQVVVGDPRDPRVTMGALAGQEQREQVRRALKALRDVAEPVWGDPDRVNVVGADADTGAFLSPVLLRATDSVRDEVHTVEAFGPVSTLIGYGDLAEAVALAARGQGSLVGSVVTHDADVARELVLGLAPWHGRVLVLDRADAAESTGHGAPLPVLVHGGPGRAGGGEELGGLRAVFHHMQRTAVQASPRVLTAVTGEWVTGAPREVTAEHPFRRSLSQLRVGDTVVAGPRVVTLDDVDHFAAFTGDTFYAHTDEQAAAANPFFGGRVAHGYLVVAFAAGLFVSPEPGPVLANYGLENLRFRTPTYPGDALTVTLTAKAVTPRGGEYGEVRWDADVTKPGPDGAPVSVATYDVLTLVATHWPPP